MFSRKSLKLKRTNESLPTAWWLKCAARTWIRRDVCPHCPNRFIFYFHFLNIFMTGSSECLTWNSASSTKFLAKAASLLVENCFNSSLPRLDSFSKVSAATFKFKIWKNLDWFFGLTFWRVSQAMMSLFLTLAASRSRFFRSRLSILFWRLKILEYNINL